MNDAVIYQPEILPSMAAICKRFNVGEKQVKFWLSSGAPIAIEGDGNKTRYSAESMRLQLWREAQSKNAQE